MAKSTQRITISALFYGDYPQLAERCLGTLAGSLLEGEDYLQDIRLILNDCCPETYCFATDWATRVQDLHGVPVIRYVTEENQCKYPLMRRIWWDDPQKPASLLMWFDDDSFLDHPKPGWYADIVDQIQGCDMLGQIWHQPMLGNQWAFIVQQPWYNARAGQPPRYKGRRCFRFCQGSWWVARRDVLHRYDWPTKALKHNGGDSLFGELCRQQGLRLRHYDRGVRLNADEKGRHSKSLRRGRSEPNLGRHYKPQVALDLSHHNFNLARMAVPEGY